TGLVCKIGQTTFYIGQGGCAVDVGFALAQKVQIRAVQQKNVHVLIPRVRKRSSRQVFSMSDRGRERYACSARCSVKWLTSASGLSSTRIPLVIPGVMKPC